MSFQTVFKRYELKYMLSPEQKAKLLSVMQPYMVPDRYGRATIRNIYFDTDHYQLIRRSMEKPAYKEKLRIRSYFQADSDSTVFVELKKKYENVVYKRRLPLREKEAMAWLCQQDKCPVQSQISQEIDYFMDFYGELCPAVFLSYEREAFYDNLNGELRITFDENILARQSDLSLCSMPGGVPILPENKIMMEIKCSGGIPLWMTSFLSQEKIYKTAFSKYATAYSRLIFAKPIEKEIYTYGSNI